MSNTSNEVRTPPDPPQERPARASHRSFGRHLAVLAAGALLAGCMLFKTDRSLFPETSVKQVGPDEIELTQPVAPIPGLALAPETRVKFQLGRIHEIKVAKDVAFGGKAFPAGSVLLFGFQGDQLLLDHATLGADTKYSDLDFKKGDELAFDENGSPGWAKINGDHKYGNKTYEDSSELTFKNGKVTRARTQAQVEAAQQAEAAEAQRNYNACKNACSPLGSGPEYGNCISRCHY